MRNCLMFSTPTCGPCKMVKMFSSEAAELANVEISYIDATEERDIVSTYGVKSVPHFVLLEGNEIVAERSGFITKDKLVEFLVQ